MSQSEYLIALISIIVGLGLTDLARSFRDLIRPDRNVHWYGLPLVWAGTVILLVLQIWWNMFELLRSGLFSDAAAFFPLLLMFLVLYLVCSFALPDPSASPTADSTSTDVSASPTIDLEAFYYSNDHRHWFFGLLILLVVIGQGVTVVWFTLQESSNYIGLATGLGINLLTAGLLAGLAFTRRRWLHVGLTLFFALVASYWLFVSAQSLRDVAAPPSSPPSTQSPPDTSGTR